MSCIIKKTDPNHYQPSPHPHSGSPELTSYSMCFVSIMLHYTNMEWHITLHYPSCCFINKCRCIMIFHSTTACVISFQNRQQLSAYWDANCVPLYTELICWNVPKVTTDCPRHWIFVVNRNQTLWSLSCPLRLNVITCDVKPLVLHYWWFWKREF